MPQGWGGSKRLGQLSLPQAVEARVNSSPLQCFALERAQRLRSRVKASAAELKTSNALLDRLNSFGKNGLGGRGTPELSGMVCQPFVSALRQAPCRLEGAFRFNGGDDLSTMAVPVVELLETGNDGASERRPCLRAFLLDAAFASGRVGSSFNHGADRIPLPSQKKQECFDTLAKHQPCLRCR